jgi:hypothetical protein
VLDGTAVTFFKGVADFGGYWLTGANTQLTLMDMVGFPGFSTLRTFGLPIWAAATSGKVRDIHHWPVNNEKACLAPERSQSTDGRNSGFKTREIQTSQSKQKHRTGYF